MPRHRTHSLEFKRQVAHDYVAGETLHSLAKRHDLSRNLIRIWVQKYETGAFDEDAIAADLVEAYEARIAALERLVGKQALELEFLKGALKHTPRPRSVMDGGKGCFKVEAGLRRRIIQVARQREIRDGRPVAKHEGAISQVLLDDGESAFYA